MDFCACVVRVAYENTCRCGFFCMFFLVGVDDTAVVLCGTPRMDLRFIPPLALQVLHRADVGWRHIPPDHVGGPTPPITTQGLITTQVVQTNVSEILLQ